MPADMPEGDPTALEAVEREIDACVSCSAISGFTKLRGVARGTTSRVMIIGQGPGSAELTHGRAFAGPSGRRLDEWLVACGAASEDPRGRIYITSLIKCGCAEVRYFRRMRGNCRGFLGRQVIAVRPELVITLGALAYDELRFVNLSYDTALCTRFDSRDHVLTTTYGFHYMHMVWPHPSPRNHWFNDAGHVDELRSSFDQVTPFLLDADR
jgi:uracil-DNA glycosylase family 4